MDKALGQRGKNALLIQFVFSALFTLALFYPNFSASWGLIDDHEIMVNLGPDRTMGVAELPERLMESEAGFAKLGRARYRPAYWMIYLTETALWDSNPHLWYAFRMLLIGGSVFISWYLISRLFGTVFSGLTCLFIFTRPYWADIGARLGPAELYALSGLSIYCLSFYRIWKGGTGAWWAFLSLGAFISFGSKENFLFLVPVTAALFLKQWKENRRLSSGALFSGIFILATGLLIGAVVLFVLGKTGSDIYGTSINPVERVAYRLLGPWNVIASFPLLASALLYAASGKTRLSLSRQDCKNLFLVQLLLFSLWTSQYFFYSGTLPTNTRYDFPGMLILSLSFVFLIHGFFKAISHARVLNTAAAFLAVLVVAASALKGAYVVHGASVENMKKTRLFTADLDRIVQRLNAEPATPVVLESHTFGDFEPLVSFARYLFVSGVKNPVAVRFEERIRPQDRSPLGLILIEKTKKFEEGDQTSPPDRLKFVPFGSVAPDTRCFVVTFSGNPTLNCEDLGRIW